MKCTYRIYPSWYGGEVLAPMRELAESSAKNMGRRVIAIDKVGYGFDHMRGHWQDYCVTYSSTETPSYEEIRR